MKVFNAEDICEKGLDYLRGDGVEKTSIGNNRIIVYNKRFEI